MEKFKQKIADLETNVETLKAELASIKGSSPARENSHFVAAGQEFGEYSLEELDTFRFNVVASRGPGNILHYCYVLTNPTPELSAYLRIQNKTFATQYIPVEHDAFEEYCMKKSGTPFVLTAEIHKCLESKLWEFAGGLLNGGDLVKVNGIDKLFTTTIVIPFTQTYNILPHVSYYITPLPLQSRSLDVECEIKEITSKQVSFKISYGNSKPYKEYDNHLKLHYAINGIVVETELI